MNGGIVRKSFDICLLVKRKCLCFVFCGAGWRVAVCGVGGGVGGGGGGVGGIGGGVDSFAFV